MIFKEILGSATNWLRNTGNFRVSRMFGDLVYKLDILMITELVDVEQHYSWYLVHSPPKFIFMVLSQSNLGAALNIG